MSVTLSAANTRHAPAIAELQELLWQGGTDGNLAYLDWKYTRNPYLDNRYVVLAWDGPDLVGMVGAFGALWEGPGGVREMLPCLADTVLAPAHRGGPLFGHMLDELAQRLRTDKVPWLLDFGDQPAGPAMRMRGWRSVGPWSVARFPLSTRGKASAVPEPGGDWICGARTGARIRLHDEVPPDEVAELLRRTSQSPNRLRHVRDGRFLAWRFANPLARHFHFSVRHDRLQGYLLAHRTLTDRDDGPTPTTVLECEAESLPLWADLMDAARCQLPGNELLIWCRDVSAAQSQVLSNLGFSIQHPTGRLTADVDLPNLLMRRIEANATQAPSAAAATPIDGLELPQAWDLRSVCGRSWR